MCVYMICLEGPGFVAEGGRDDGFTFTESRMRALATPDFLFMCAIAKNAAKLKRTTVYVLKRMLNPNDWRGMTGLPCVWHLEGCGFLAGFGTHGRLRFSASVLDGLEYTIDSPASYFRTLDCICSYAPRVRRRKDAFMLLKIVATFDGRHGREGLS